jgi:hypothetical protein
MDRLRVWDADQVAARRPARDAPDSVEACATARPGHLEAGNMSGCKKRRSLERLRLDILKRQALGRKARRDRERARDGGNGGQNRYQDGLLDRIG